MSNHAFKPRAQLLLQLGDQLIKNESVALIELIKNSYDADADDVTVILNDIDKPEIGEIIVKDDGFGMTKDIIENVWLEPGNTHKKDLVETGQRSPKGRLPIGEKGIGRFGVHKLGRQITLITRAEKSKEIIVELDWDKFTNAKYLEDIDISIQEREPLLFPDDKTGTQIEIRKLRKEWKYSSFLQICRAINNLHPPFSETNGFLVSVSCNLPEWENKCVTFDSIKNYSLFNFSANISKFGEIKYDYHFTPFDTMTGIDARDVHGSEKAVTSKNEDIIELNDNGEPKVRIGDFSFHMFAFDRDSEMVKKYVIEDKKSFKSYLDENGGIYVFRDDLRIYDYGEKGNDWLQLDIKRVNRPGETLSNNVVIGVVQLKREESLDLIEKANREGFIENRAYEILKQLLERAIELFLTERNIDKEKYRSLKPFKEPVLSELAKLTKLIEDSDATDSQKIEMTKYVTLIGKEYDYIKEITLTTASAGLTYGVVIHEIEKIIKELVEETLQKAEPYIMRDKIMHLSDTIENYANLLRDRKKTQNTLISVAKRAKKNCAYRFKAHNIECLIDESTFVQDNISCTFNLIVSSVMNLFDNSIWWIERSKVTEKKIKVCMSDYLEGYKTLLVIDNGFGFSILPEDAIKPFVSKKPGGMGVGLNIVNEIMSSHDGLLVFPSIDELIDINITDISPKAIVGLAFKK